jgi:hypothetical protein
MVQEKIAGAKLLILDACWYVKTSKIITYDT